MLTYKYIEESRPMTGSRQANAVYISVNGALEDNLLHVSATKESARF